MANDGLLDQARAAVKETLGDAKNAAQQIHDSHKDASLKNTEQARDNLRDSIQEVEEEMKGKIQHFKERHIA